MIPFCVFAESKCILLLSLSMERELMAGEFIAG